MSRRNIEPSGACKKDPDFRLKGIELLQDDKTVVISILNGKELKIKIAYQLYSRLVGFRVFLDLCDDIGNVLFRSFHDENTEGITTLEPGCGFCAGA